MHYKETALHQCLKKWVTSPYNKLAGELCNREEQSITHKAFYANMANEQHFPEQNEPGHEILVLIASACSQCSDTPALPSSLIRAFNDHVLKVWK